MQDLTYAGTLIHQRQDMLSLTDMWKAAGSDLQQAPAKWRVLSSTITFVEHIELTVGKSDGLFSVKEGRGGGTFAHWQIGLAYAKYLSPEFHAWCNQVVRERMEGRPAVEALTAAQVGGITKAVTNKLLADYLTPLSARVDALMAGFDPTLAVVADYQPMLTLLDARGVKPRKRRALSQRCSRLCTRWLIAKGRGADIRLSRETHRYLFQVAAAQEWMQAQGNAVIAEHQARIAGQTIMQFKPAPKLVEARSPDHPGQPP